MLQRLQCSGFNPGSEVLKTKTPGASCWTLKVYILLPIPFGCRGMGINVVREPSRVVGNNSRAMIQAFYDSSRFYMRSFRAKQARLSHKYSNHLEVRGVQQQTIEISTGRTTSELMKSLSVFSNESFVLVRPYTYRWATLQYNLESRKGTFSTLRSVKIAKSISSSSPLLHLVWNSAHQQCTGIQKR